MKTVFSNSEVPHVWARQSQEEGKNSNRNIYFTGPKIYSYGSKGARVSYEAGKLLFAMIKAGKDVKGHDIDGYTVISINGVLKIGCHVIEMAEVHRFAKMEGWE